MEHTLSGKHIAVPETRQLDILANMLEKRGATVLRCPLVSIHDTPNSDTVYNWLDDFINQPPNDFILLTGEGLRRLNGFASRSSHPQLATQFTQALAQCRTICRGPKPGAALRQLGLKPHLLGITPTTDGIIETLTPELLTERRVAVQLYGEHPNMPLIDFLKNKGAIVTTVAPYIYADAAEEHKVIALMDALDSHTLDAITFTSMSQVSRIFKIAKRHQRLTQLQHSLNRCTVASVGPLVRDALAAQQVSTDVMPEEQYFMKPLVNALAAKLN